jgi:hypothetical protein
VTAGQYGATPLGRALAAVQGQRRGAIEQLVQGVAPIPWSPVAEPCDDWAEVLVQTAAFGHIRVSPGCRGYTTWNSGRAACGLCGWEMSARMGEVGMPGSAWFAQAALARYGQVIALAVGAVVQALFEAVMPC